MVFASAWFTAFCAVAYRLVGGHEAGTFGEERIAGPVSHGVVLGLEDARAGGGGLFLALTAAYFLGPILILGLGCVLPARRSKPAGRVHVMRSDV
jgi:hypothetical protein